MTLCTQGRERLFGSMDNGKMVLSDAGCILVHWWRELENKSPLVKIDTCVVMPDHFHGILFIVGAPLCGCPSYGGADLNDSGRPRRAAPTVGDLVGWFKTMTSNAYIRGVKKKGWPPFSVRLWQRNYFEHVIRSEEEIDEIRDYILHNPQRWSERT